MARKRTCKIWSVARKELLKAASVANTYRDILCSEVELGSINAVAKKYGVSWQAVKNRL